MDRAWYLAYSPPDSSGIDGYIVTVECSPLRRSAPAGCRRSADRRGHPKPESACAPPRKPAAFDWPVSRLTVNLAPADTKKAGTAYDLPILLSILAAAGEIDALPQRRALLRRAFPHRRAASGAAARFPWRLPRAMRGFRTVSTFPAMNAAEGILCFRCDGVFRFAH